jgi:pyridoxal phosphate enzyme (YggS family)
VTGPVAELAERLAAVDARVAEAARSAGRDAAGITRIVVTKFHPAELVRELHGLGVRDVAENRQQELTAKAEELAGLEGLRWHFVGQLQTKKARIVRRAAAAVHSVDRDRLVDALEAAAQPGDAPLDVLVQINLTTDAGRGGIVPAEAERLAERIALARTLRLRGVMAVAPLGEPAGPAFERLAALSERVRSVEPTASWVSAGMSADLEEAVAHGATHLRIGSAITGPRQARG